MQTSRTRSRLTACSWGLCDIEHVHDIIWGGVRFLIGHKDPTDGVVTGWFFFRVIDCYFPEIDPSPSPLSGDNTPRYNLTVVSAKKNCFNPSKYEGQCWWTLFILWPLPLPLCHPAGGGRPTAFGPLRLRAPALVRRYDADDAAGQPAGPERRRPMSCPR